jgi:outer membrane receptor protein involved in Fe transport
MAGDTFHAETQYDLELFGGNLLIAGADFRFTRYRSHQTVRPSVDESRFGVFLHDEQILFDRLLVTVGARLDINTKTDTAISPQIAVVYNPAGEHFFRVSAGTAFRKPTLTETSANFKVVADPAFQEIETLFEEKGVSNPELENESLSTIEAGYLGSFFEKALRLSADFYVGFDRKQIGFISNIQFRLPPWDMQIDVDNSRIGYVTMSGGTDNAGFSLGIEGDPAEDLTLFLRCDYEYRWWIDDQRQERWDPSLFGSVGGVLRLSDGLLFNLSMLYVGSRVHILRNPYSILGTPLEKEISEQLHLVASLAYRFQIGRSRLDLGMGIFHLFGGRYREAVGVILRDGSSFGGERIGTQAMFTARLQY